MKNQISLHSLFAVCVWLTSCPVFAQQSTAFTYQGQLRDGGTNANGAYSMAFKLYDSASGGSQIGDTINANPTLVNGLFTVNLDFGAGAFNGTARWLDITVQSGSSSAETLAPRVQVLPTPYAQFAAVAATVTNGAIMNQQLAASAVATTNIQINAITTTLISNNAITNRNLSANAVNATNIAAGQVVKSLNGLRDFALLLAGTNVVIITNGNSLIVGAMQPSYGVIDYSTTIIVPTNLPAGGWRFMFEVWGAGGGGGGGGGSGNYGAWYGGSGGGGGGGAYGKQILTLNPGDSITVTVGTGGAGGSGGYSYGSGTNGATGATGGTGGTSSVVCSAGTITATGGAGGTGGGGGAGGTPSYGDGGNPGTSTADIAISGFHGWPAIAGYGPGGAGAKGGAGGAAGPNAGSYASGQSPGGGGTGGGGGISSFSATVGQPGASGRVIIWW